MDFDLTEEQRLLVESARAFARHELAPKAADWDRDHHFPVEVIRAAAEQGYLGLYIAEEDGGLGLSRLSTSLIFEQLAAGCMATTAYISIHNMAAWMLASFGDAALKEAWLPGLIGGESLASYCLTEARCRLRRRAPAHPRPPRGRRIRAGRQQVLHFRRRQHPGADRHWRAPARTAPGASPASWCRPTRPASATAATRTRWAGARSRARTITFEGVRIPAGNRIGPEGQGFVYAMKGLDGGRLNIASCSLGAAQAALEQSMRYVEEREQFGKPLATFQALQFKLADMLTELTASRQMVRLGAHRLDRGDAEATLYCAMAKRFATDRCFDVCNEALQLHGGYGYLNDYPLERWVRDTRVHQILEGTNEIMRVIVARRLLEQGGMLDRLL